MVLLPLACEPLEYLRGRFSNEEKQQDKVGCIFLHVFRTLSYLLSRKKTSILAIDCLHQLPSELKNLSNFNFPAEKVKQFLLSNQIKTIYNIDRTLRAL